MPAPLLSLCVPVYNGEKFLSGCLDSLESAVSKLTESERASLEIVLCDNHSTDRSLALLQERAFSCVCRVVQPPEHFKNRTQNWDFALRSGSGDWIVMLHADDRMAPDGFGAMLRAIRQKAVARAALIGGRHRIFKEGEEPGELLPRWPLPSLVSGTALRQQVLPILCVFLPFMLIRREIYESIGGLDSKYELLQDWDLWFRALERGDYYYHPEAFCHWFSHPYGSNLSELFAREHLKFLHALSEAGSGSLERSASFQLAKLRTWLPDTDPVALVQGQPEEAYVRELRPVDSASAPGVLKSCGREIGVRMQALRLIGYFRR